MFPSWLLSFALWWEPLSLGAKWAYGSAFVVFIGVVGETIADLTRWISDEFLRKRVEKISALILILGLAGDLISISIGQREFEEVLKQAGDAKISASDAAEAASRAKLQSNGAQSSASSALTLAQGARREADSFEMDIVSAKKLAADAESHLASALKQAADAERELDEYKAKNAPRRLNAKEQESIASRLSFPNEHVDLAWYGFERGQFAFDIQNALKLAHWDVSISQSLDFSGVSGVLILTMPTDRSEGAGKQLFDALKSQEVSVSIGSMREYIPGYSKLTVDRKSQELRSDTRLLVIVGDHP